MATCPKWDAAAVAVATLTLIVQVVQVWAALVPRPNPTPVIVQVPPVCALADCPAPPSSPVPPASLAMWTSTTVRPQVRRPGDGA